MGLARELFIALSLGTGLLEIEEPEAEIRTTSGWSYLPGSLQIWERKLDAPSKLPLGFLQHSWNDVPLIPLLPAAGFSPGDPSACLPCLFLKHWT